MPGSRQILDYLGTRSGICCDSVYNSQGRFPVWERYRRRAWSFNRHSASCLARPSRCQSDQLWI